MNSISMRFGTTISLVLKTGKQLTRLGYCVILFLVPGSCSAQTVSRLIEAEEETVTIEKLHYYLYFPETYATEENQLFPLLLFLHGGGESGQKLSTLKTNGPPKLIAEGKQFPFIILAPQNPYKKKWWNTRAVMQLLDTVLAQNRVDPNRIYLTGLSRGGGAAWELAVQYPERFAAMAVVCGMTPVPYAAWISRDMPIWVFHGTADASIPFSESDNMVKKLRELGHTVRFTVYKGKGHNVWDQAYKTPGLYDWFMEQERKK